MRSRSVKTILLHGSLVVACDAHIPFNEGRHVPPERAAWQVRLTAPERFDSRRERRDNGALLHALVTGAPGRYEVSASLSGRSCEGLGGNLPLVDVQADGVSLARFSVTAGPPAAYVASFVLDQRPRRLDLLLTNALATDRCYRNVTLDWLQIRRR
jgi:hypothetical protein